VWVIEHFCGLSGSKRGNWSEINFFKSCQPFFRELARFDVQNMKP